MYESGENYLETILLLKQETGFVRSVDVATALGYSKPSISRAMGILRKSGYIQIGGDGEIEFTPKGREMAEHIYERHRIITRFLVETLGVDETVADRDACRIEHIISPEVFEAMKRKAHA